MATTIMDTEQKRFIKKFHVLLGKAGVDQAGKEAILAGYGVESTKDLTAYELLEACNALDKLANPEVADLDKWRKRVLASVLGYLRAMGMGEDMNKAKAIATRAAKAEYFNAIKVDQLRNIYSAFNKKTRDANSVEEVTRDMITNLKNYN